MKRLISMSLLAAMSSLVLSASAQSLFHRADSILAARYYRLGNKFLGLSMVFNFTNIGDKDNLTVQNNKWRIRTFFGLRLGKR